LNTIERVCRSCVGSPLDVYELRSVRHRVESDDEIAGQLHRQHRLLAGWQLDRIDRELGEAVS
jgi:hypothetical protein